MEFDSLWLHDGVLYPELDESLWLGNNLESLEVVLLLPGLLEQRLQGLQHFLYGLGGGGVKDNNT